MSEPSTAADQSAAPSAGRASRPPFFIVGADRSGTTMLRLILDRAGAGAALPPETMFISDFLGAWHEGGLDDHAAAVALTRRVWNHPKVRQWGIGGEPELPPPGLPHEEAFRWAVEQPYLAYMRRDGKQWWADKTPPYIDRIDELAAIFPGAKFIELVRDGRDVALSILTVPFGDATTWHAARRWAHCVRVGAEQRRRRPDDVLLVRYEDLVAEPEAHVRRICEFLDIDFDPDMLRVEETDPSKIVAHQQAWFSNLWGGINQRAVRRWERQMPTREQREFLAAAGPELEMHGYAPGASATEPLVPGALRRAWLGLRNIVGRIVNLVKLRLVEERGSELRWVIARRLGRS